MPEPIRYERFAQLNGSGQPDATYGVREFIVGTGGAGLDTPGAEVATSQVLNATTTRGLARRATELLRDRGFDVVDVGSTAAQERGDSTFVLDRSGHPDWARRVAAAMGGARVIARPDSSRYLDVTVLVGASWRPPAQPFHP